MGNEIVKIFEDVLSTIFVGILVVLAVCVVLVLAVLGLLHLAGVEEAARIVFFAAAGLCVLCVLVGWAREFFGLSSSNEGALGTFFLIGIVAAMIAGATWAVQSLAG